MSGAYPARMEAEIEPGLSRWLWLVKWILLIPHAIVLAFLWVAVVVVTLIAMVAIVVTTRYPRWIFDYNVGVLRWTWRIGFYAYSANGTDRYPPFSLGEADYPTHFDVEYPERLSRLQAPFKPWLLALPQVAIVGILLGGGWNGPGLIGLLTLIGVVALLFTGRFPAGIHDLLLGLNRWCLRVGAYTLLMTDRYPPFRLDAGEREPVEDDSAQPGNAVSA